MRLAARTDYGIRAVAHLAASCDGGPIAAGEIAEANHIPPAFLFDILRDLASARIVRSQRGATGGYLLAADPAELTIGHVIRALDGPLANFHELSLSDLRYPGVAEHLCDVWKAIRTALRSVLDEVTFADLVSGNLPEQVRRMADDYNETKMVGVLTSESTS